LDRRLGGPQSCLDAVVKRKIPRPCWESNPVGKKATLTHYNNAKRETAGRITLHMSFPTVNLVPLNLTVSAG
jgi:hypothetical protein